MQVNLARTLWLLPGILAIILTKPSPGHTEGLTWKGCGITKIAFMSEIATAFEKKTGTAIQLNGGGASKGIRAASANTTNIGGTCRHHLKNASGNPIPEEQNANLIQVAWDALVVIVHPDNPVDNISMQQLQDIFDGKISSWSQLGGPNKPIVLVTRDGLDSGVGHMFRLLVFNDPKKVFKSRSLKLKSTGPVERKVEKTPMALAMDGISSARKRKLKFLSINGIFPNKDNIAQGLYPLFRPLYLAINRHNAGARTLKVIDFVLSHQGQKIISQQQTVNLAEGFALNKLWAEKTKDMGLSGQLPDNLR